jgi:hypothetical protein
MISQHDTCLAFVLLRQAWRGRVTLWVPLQESSFVVAASHQVREFRGRLHRPRAPTEKVYQLRLNMLLEELSDPLQVKPVGLTLE